MMRTVLVNMSCIVSCIVVMVLFYVDFGAVIFLILQPWGVGVFTCFVKGPLCFWVVWVRAVVFLVLWTKMI